MLAQPTFADSRWPLLAPNGIAGRSMAFAGLPRLAFAVLRWRMLWGLASAGVCWHLPAVSTRLPRAAAQEPGAPNAGRPAPRTELTGPGGKNGATGHAQGRGRGPQGQERGVPSRHTEYLGTTPNDWGSQPRRPTPDIGTAARNAKALQPYMGHQPF